MVSSTYHLDLITGAQEGDYTSINSLALFVEKRIYPYIRRVSIQSDICDDLLQETQLEMVKSVHKLREPKYFWTWINRIARSKIQQYFLNQKRDKFILYSDEVAEYINPEKSQSDILSQLISKENVAQLSAAILQLKPEYKDVICLYYFEKKSYGEIGSLLKCTPLLARIRVHRAKQILRNSLNNYFN